MLTAQEAPEPQTDKLQPLPLAHVQYQTFQASLVDKTIDLYGRTAPNRQANLAAEASGKIVHLLVRKGERVKQNQPIAQIDKADFASQLARAKANLDVKEKEFKAATTLKNRGLQGEVAYSSAQAALIEAKA